MCGRYYIADDDRLIEMIRRLNEIEQRQVKTGRVCPGDTALVFVGNKGIQPRAMQWGFQTQRRSLLINARSETAADRPAFAAALRSSRLLVPATSYFEWDSSKKMHEFSLGEAGAYFAGLYEPVNRRFVILTRKAAPSLESIHDRMPVVFTRTLARKWLDADCDPEQVLKQAQTDCVKESAGQVRLNI